MSLQIGICDDSTDDIRRLSDALYAYDGTIRITDYTDGESLIEDCQQQKIPFDIIFLDIYMPRISGIQTAEKIRACRKDVILIFVSSSNEHYPEAYDLFAFNYIIKPINVDKLNKVMKQAMNHITKEREQQICFTYKSAYYRIACRDIFYIESQDKVILFHTADKSIYKCYTKLDEILAQLPQEFFIRCHQSYVVNLNHVTEMSENHFRIDQSVISISKKYQKEAKDKYFDYLFTHMNIRGMENEKQ